MKTENTQTPAAATPNTFSRKIGNTTFLVSVVFSEKSNERIEDKILRLVTNENQQGVIPQCN